MTDTTAPHCTDIWFNDPEADHVHRCDSTAGHVDYHSCAHTY